MRKRPKLFTPPNAYSVIRVMLQSVGLNVSDKIPAIGKPHICHHEHINLMVMRGESRPTPTLVFLTKNDTYLFAVEFEDADCTISFGERSKHDVGRLPRDPSLYNALALYITMCEAGDAYIDEHFHIRSFPEIMREFGPVRID